MSRENPMLGTYRILSATTNPTGKNRLEAGTKGKMMRERACIVVGGCEGSTSKIGSPCHISLEMVVVS